MSELRVDNIVSQSGSAAPVYSQGVIVGSGKTFTVRGDVDFQSGANVSGAVTFSSLSIASGFDVSGVVTATSFTGPLIGTANTASSLASGATGADLTLSGNLTVNGTTTTIDTAVTAVDSLAVDGNVTALGTLGIGTVTPGRHLTVSGGAYEGAIQITNNTSGHTAANGFELIHFTSGETQFLNRENGAMRFDTNGTERLRIDATGNSTFTGTVSDSKGDLRKIIFKQESSAYTLVAADAGKAIEIATGGITVPVNVFTGGDAITILNDSSSNQTITQGSSVTMFNAGTTNSGNRTLAGRGMATVYFVNSSTCYISGAGLS